jgi:two-component system, cell cycle response regulator
VPRAYILVADDDAAIRDTVCWVLREHGYDVQAVESAAGVFAALETRTPDLLLLDVMMPEMDGFEALEKVKADERWRELPVLMFSAMPAEEATIKTLGLGAADFIRKPFRVKELLARIQAQLRMRALLSDARQALRQTEEELLRAREEAENRRKLVDILHEVTGDLSPDEIYHLLARRVARALSLSHCSVILARPGDRVGVIATAYEEGGLRKRELDLDRYPEIRAALDRGRPVLIEDLVESPLFANVRDLWEREGTQVRIRSVIALPFALDRLQAGVFFLRRTVDEPSLSQEDVEFADAVVKAAVASIQKAQLLETAKKDNARLEALAHTDPLTQVLNRRALTLRLTAELERSRRYDSVLSLLLIDIDHFKRINDTHGHLVGDEVLREVARLLAAAVRSVDLVARYGGEEFVVVLPETSLEGALIFAERVREQMAETQFPGAAGRSLSLTVSIGVATFPSGGVETVEELFARSDEALYRSKAGGRNRVVVGMDA